MELQPETPQWEPWEAELKKLGFKRKETVVYSPYPEGNSHVKTSFERPFGNGAFIYNADERVYVWYYVTYINNGANSVLLNIREKDDLLRLFHYMNVLPEKEIAEYNTLQKIVDQIEMGNYQCEGGYLKNSIGFLALKQMAQNEDRT
jgi:hypothetical protein